MAFPINPTDKQEYRNYLFNATINAWEKRKIGTIAERDIHISTVDPISTDGEDGDIWLVKQ